MVIDCIEHGIDELFYEIEEDGSEWIGLKLLIRSAKNTKGGKRQRIGSSSVVNNEALSFDEVVRYRRNNPDHLETGSRCDNKHDDWLFAAYGVDPLFL